MPGFYDPCCDARRAIFFGFVFFSMLLGLFFTVNLYGHPSSVLAPPPAAPSGLKATPISSAHINLNWTDNSSDETGFKIEIRFGDADAFTQIATVGANVTSYSSTGLFTSTEYVYRVRAYSAGGNSAYSNEVSATTLPDIPAAPSNLTATAASKSQINLQWTDNSNDETGFKIERKSSGAAAYSPVTMVGSNVTSYSNTGLSPNTTYSYRVLAHNSGGDSDYSNSAEAKTLPNLPPAPSGLTATSMSATQIKLAWTDNANNETGFKIERKNGAAGTYNQVATVGSNIKSYTSTGLGANTTYFFRVRAYNAGGHSDYSNEASAKTFSLPPAAPSNLTATTASSNKIVLAWTDNSGNETGFKIERKTGAATYAEVGTVGVNVKSFSDVNLIAKTTYFYRVRAYNAGGTSVFSNEASATTLLSPPTAPNNLVAAVGQGQIKLAWIDNANNESGFKIERKTGAAGAYAQVANIGANIVGFVDSNLSANTEYFYRLRAYNAGGNSGYSNEANATTLPNPPPPPNNLTATAVSDSRIDLAWTENAGDETGFKIERKTGAGGAYTEIATVGANVTGYSNTGLTANTQYFYRVRAHNVGGNSAYSNEANAIPFSNVNLALNKPATASSTDTSSTTNRAVDGDLLTYWRSGFVNGSAPTAWLRVQLSASSSVPVGRAVIKWSQSYYAIEYELQVSNDGVSWTSVYVNTAGFAGTQDLSFVQTMAKYIRLYMKKNEKSNYRVLEFEVYANPSAAKRLEGVAETAMLPDAIALAQNYPNPFSPFGRGIFDNSTTQIGYELPAAGQMSLIIYNSLGQEVRRLVEKQQAAGYHHVTWNGRDQNGKPVPSGIYLYRLQVGDFVTTKRMLIAK